MNELAKSSGTRSFNGDLPTIRINAQPPTLCDLLAYLPVMQKQNSNKRMMMTITENGIPCRMAMCNIGIVMLHCRRSVFPPLRKVKVFSSSSSPRRNEEEEEVAKRKSCWTFSWLSLFMFIFLLPPFSASQTCWSINR